MGEQQTDAEKRLQAVTEAVILWRDRPGGDIGLAISLSSILDIEKPEPPASAALGRVRDLHTRVLRMEALVCAHCGCGWPCDTIRALDGHCPRCPHHVHSEFCGVTAGINQCACTGNVIPV